MGRLDVCACVIIPHGGVVFVAGASMEGLSPEQFEISQVNEYVQ